MEQYPIQIDPIEYAKFAEHCVSEHPNEACGLLVDGRFVPIPNTSEEPRTSFVMAKGDYVKASLSGTIEAVLHSHPIDPKRRELWPAHWPSSWDMTSHMKQDLPWGIVSCEGENITEQHDMTWLNAKYTAPLIGRRFVHGVWDCYSICRDWYKLNCDLELPDFPREMRWWKKDKNLYTENFAKLGFVVVPRSELQVGDAVLIQYDSKVINHAGIVTGPNELTHHMAGMLSGRDALSNWAEHIVHVVRHPQGTLKNAA